MMAEAAVRSPDSGRIVGVRDWRACRSLRGAGHLLLAHLRQREASADCDYAQDWMRRIARQAQGVHSFPRSNAHIRRIQIRALFCEFEPPLLGALLLFERETLGVSPDELRRGTDLGKLRFVHGQLFEGYDSGQIVCGREHAGGWLRVNVECDRQAETPEQCQ